ncbi:hypothetical protein INS49_011575 [Diaporthe citri]|uniref:uncharacterized protein n=1 Tax=Diaporthe citri TaxID=83186 RepID=UPI001C8156AE|nr:uncharacterized protein INS49_011575 [Diaporthe citri]KAG6360513.1 hypothetical protein INS49_011575 [Diaporthe citri]
MNATVPEAEAEKTRETNPPLDVQADQRKRISSHLEKKLKDFSFAEFQRLNLFTGKLQEAKLAISLKIGVLEQDLEADTATIEALILLIEDGKRLYDTILQSYNMEINKLFTFSGHGISERMEDSALRMEKVTDSMLEIARATARDSASMSVITFVTLVLLPGAFIGTFFSTPIIDTPQNNAQSVHQDLKPSNIFVFERGDVSATEFDLTFKIGGIGNSHTRKTAPYSSGRLGLDSGSTRTYCPPELYWNHEVDFVVGPLQDMWSLGCVLIEAAPWVCFGRRGRIESQQRRRDENNEVAPEQRDLGRSDCFHNGKARLKTVDEVFDLVQRNGRR